MRQHCAQGPPNTRVRIAAVAHRATLPKKVSGSTPHRRVITKMAPVELAPLVLVIAAGITKMAPTQKATGPGDYVAHAALATDTAGRASAATVPAIS